MLPSVATVAKMIDHSLLRPELTKDDIKQGCELAAQYAVASVCVRPYDVPVAVGLLRGTGVLIGTVVGFPHGNSTSATKMDETRDVIAAGADEIDMVLPIGRLRDADELYVHDDIAAVVSAAETRCVKVILETSFLCRDGIIMGCRAADEAGADFVKTSTGFAGGGATIEDVALMRASVSDHVQVKAAGGVRSLDTLLALHSAGATRFGATVTAAILDDLATRQAA
ncbi:deoxyribose-phosphate aldolase [Pseudonocardia sp. TRM90224]|uniref:deoxyribose-phosphate aldolase n=1 Tax=Pseudonocardia sp. TRM90224 TaxID=2812678 RepID=UPI001E54327A|nr:deoxyribose-phosphate aldolase [Pseudonocardia sp. TRM90224]